MLIVLILVIGLNLTTVFSVASAVVDPDQMFAALAFWLSVITIVIDVLCLKYLFN